eukprot:12233266-Alexandrium_andersonii.AAC.1
MRACRPPDPPKERHLLAGGTFAAPEALVGGSGGAVASLMRPLAPEAPVGGSGGGGSRRKCNYLVMLLRHDLTIQNVMIIYFATNTYVSSCI